MGLHQRQPMDNLHMCKGSISVEVYCEKVFLPFLIFIFSPSKQHLLPGSQCTMPGLIVHMLQKLHMLHMLHKHSVCLSGLHAIQISLLLKMYGAGSVNDSLTFSLIRTCCQIECCCEGNCLLFLWDGARAGGREVAGGSLFLFLLFLLLMF